MSSFYFCLAEAPVRDKNQLQGHSFASAFTGTKVLAYKAAAVGGTWSLLSPPCVCVCVVTPLSTLLLAGLLGLSIFCTVKKNSA
jgi:hypothetical protein